MCVVCDANLQCLTSTLLAGPTTVLLHKHFFKDLLHEISISEQYQSFNFNLGEYHKDLQYEISTSVLKV